MNVSTMDLLPIKCCHIFNMAIFFYCLCHVLHFPISEIYKMHPSFHNISAAQLSIFFKHFHYTDIIV